jgi:hypothetical protein
MEHFLSKMGCGIKEFHVYIVWQQYTSISRITINNICVNYRIYTGSVFSLTLGSLRGKTPYLRLRGGVIMTPPGKSYMGIFSVFDCIFPIREM